MAGRDIIRGHLRRAQTQVLNNLVVGDSINNYYVTGSYYNMLSYNIGNWSSSLVRFVGQAFGMVSPGVTMNGVYCSLPGSGAGYPTAGGTIRPGEAWPQTGETKINVRTTSSYYAAADIGAFGSLFQVSSQPTGPADANWTTSTTLTCTVKARSSTTSVTSWFLNAYTQDAAPLVSSGSTTAMTTLNAAASFKIYSVTNFSTSSTTTRASTNVGFCHIRSGAETENGTTIRDMAFLDFGLRNTTRTTGIFWGYCGHGSWKPNNHSSESGSSITADPPTYTGAYSDAALAADYTAYQWNHVTIWIGANPNNAGDLTASAAAYKSDILAIIARHRAAALSAGLSNPKFTLVSQYTTSTINEYWKTLQQALYEIALADTDVEFIDLYAHVLATIGPHASWSGNTSYTPDGVHPGPLLRSILSAQMAKIGFGGNILPSSPSPGGPHSSSKLSWLRKKTRYRAA